MYSIHWILKCKLIQIDPCKMDVFKVKGIVELRELEKKIQEKNCQTLTKNGLQALSERHLGKYLNKSWRIRGGDWEAENLSDLQVSKRS